MNRNLAGASPGTDDVPRLGEKLGYAAGDLASNFYWKTAELFMLFFYTDVFGISAAAAGTMLLVTRVWDAFCDPLFGALADRTRTRFGKFRPYLVWMSGPMAITGVLAFTTPSFGQGGKLAWAYVTYGLMMLTYSAINIPYSALLGVITSDSHQRTSLSSLKFVGAFTGGVIVAQLTPRLVAALGNGNDARGWQLTMAVYGLIALVLFLTTFFSTRERVTPPPEQKTPIRQDLGDLVSNRPWMILFFMGLLVILTIAFRNGTAAYYLKYYAGRDDLLSAYLMSGMIAYATGAALTPFMTRRMGKKRLYIILMVIVGVLSIAFFLVPRDAVWLMFALHIGTSLALGPKSPIVWSMYADTADYSEWRTGRRATGFVFAAATFSIKAGAGLAGALTGWLLSAVGYVPNQAQTASAQNGIVLLMSVIPGVLAIAAALVVRSYSLDEAELSRIQGLLKARRHG